MDREHHQQWMCKNIPDNSEPLEQFLTFIQNIFFKQMNTHIYNLTRLVWLSRWIGTSQKNIFYDDEDIDSYQNCEENVEPFLDMTQRKRIDLLTKLWNKKYFHPFATTKESFEIVNNDKTLYVVSLSSTIPGMIRLSYWNNGVKHHRISLDEYEFKNIKENIGYELIKLENVIQNHIDEHSCARSFAVYISSDVNMEMENYKSETNS